MKMEINFHAQVSTFNLKLAERFCGEGKRKPDSASGRMCGSSRPFLITPSIYLLCIFFNARIYALALIVFQRD